MANIFPGKDWQIVLWLEIQWKWIIEFVLLTVSSSLSKLLSFIAVYDVTIGYKYRCPSFMDNAFGVDPAEVHVHIRRVRLDDIPTAENEVTSWLMDTFRFKDQLLSDFHSKGHFPNPGTEKELSTVKCLLNAFGVIFLTCTCTYLTFFSSIWFKVYVSSVCAYLASATYFNIRPRPIAGSGKAVVTRNGPKHWSGIIQNLQFLSPLFHITNVEICPTLCISVSRCLDLPSSFLEEHSFMNDECWLDPFASHVWLRFARFVQSGLSFGLCGFYVLSVVAPTCC